MDEKLNKEDAEQRAEAGADPSARSSESPPLRRPMAPDVQLGEVRRGRKPGTRYVRVTPRRERPFETVEAGELRATSVALRPRNRVEASWLGFKRLLVGAPLPTSQLMEERLSKVKALPIFSSDMLSSSAYATEEILLILLLASTVAFKWSLPIALAIAALVAVVAISYSQVIRGYPSGGGSYAVAKSNLGTFPGLVAGASLVVDYVLTVAVSTAAGVAAIVSVAPALHDERVIVAVISVVVLTLANLRGLRESGTLFAVPAYFFMFSLSTVIITGLIRLALGQDLTAAVPKDTIAEGGQAVGLFLLLRAFASGSAALTGIEAVSNGVPAFKAPEAANANITLAWMAAILSFFFVGLTVLAHQMAASPAETRTVVAQVAAGVFGHNILFYAVQAATMLILLLAANTSFAGFPSLGSVMARDGFLPKQFAFRGDRLAFSHGIIFLGLASVALLVVFGAETHRLIPLYAVGVFTGFTLSQAGMVVHWRREPSARARLSLAVNVVGALATAVVAVIIAATKFRDGAWLSIAAIALLILVFERIHDHYQRAAKQLEVEGLIPHRSSTARREVNAQMVIVPMEELDQSALNALERARELSQRVGAVHVTGDADEAEIVRKRWSEIAPEVPLTVFESGAPSFVASTLAYIDDVQRRNPEAPIIVVLPELVPARFWEGLLHNQPASRLRRALRRRLHTVVVNVPYQISG